MYLVWKFENFDKLQLSYSETFFAETSHTFSTYQCQQKGVWGFFILFRSCVISKNLRNLVSAHSFLALLLITYDPKKIPHSFVDITK